MDLQKVIVVLVSNNKNNSSYGTWLGIGKECMLRRLPWAAAGSPGQLRGARVPSRRSARVWLLYTAFLNVFLSVFFWQSIFHFTLGPLSRRRVTRPSFIAVLFSSARASTGHTSERPGPSFQKKNRSTQPTGNPAVNRGFLLVIVGPNS